MEILFFKDGRKTNTVEAWAKDSDGKVLLDEKGRKVVERLQVEYKTVLLELPVHENKINFDNYARGSKFHLLTEAEFFELTRHETGEPKYTVPKSFISALRTILNMLLDLLKDCEQEKDAVS